MSKFELKLPKMGESVAEATITSWLKNVGDSVELDEVIVEIATDKVDSEVPCEVEGILMQKMFEVDDVVEVGQVIAIIEIDTDIYTSENFITEKVEEITMPDIPTVESVKSESKIAEDVWGSMNSPSGKFYSPLVKNIAKTEGISMKELESLVGTGKNQRVTKNDVLAYIESKRNFPSKTLYKLEKKVQIVVPDNAAKDEQIISSVKAGDEIVEMTRMGKLIARHMVDSVHTSAHVQSFIEVDVTNVVHWRNKIKDEFFDREGEKITFTPIFMEAVCKAIRDFPMINISVEGDKIIKHRDINIGMATALPNGNLIVPVIKKADQLNLVGMTKAVNDLANRARSGKLNPDDIQGGTYTVTNVGSFGSIMGTPIINQPQVGILALGVIRKLPSVIETPKGDFIGIRHKMILSHSYDHRVINGALGGMFVKKVADYIEAWDLNTNY